MKKKLFSTILFSILFLNAFAQNKTVIAIAPFSNSSYNSNSNIAAIQDAVSDAFLKAKRFTLVEREKMALIKTEKKTQQGEDFIDGNVVEQSKSMGADFIVTASITEASFEEKSVGNVQGFTIPSRTAKIAFALKVLDVATGEIIASEKFGATEKGKNGFNEALDIIRPQLENFIKDNFKATVSLASIESKGASNDATEVLISGGTSLGLKPQTILKVYELSYIMVDGKRLARKKELGQVSVIKVEDENFSLCRVINGGTDILKKFESGSKLKCEMIN